MSHLEDPVSRPGAGLSYRDRLERDRDAYRLAFKEAEGRLRRIDRLMLKLEADLGTAAEAAEDARARSLLGRAVDRLTRHRPLPEKRLERRLYKAASMLGRIQSQTIPVEKTTTQRQQRPPSVETPGRRAVVRSVEDPGGAELDEFRTIREEIRSVGLPADAAGLPVPVDRSGLLHERGTREHDRPTVDVVVCVHDAPHDVWRCLGSVIDSRTYPLHLIVVDDGSGEPTKCFLERFARDNPSVTLIRNDGPEHGYTLAANLGVRASTADYVVMLNSDTVVSRGWLDRLVECGESDSRIGIVGPLSNAASHQSVPEVKDDDMWATNPMPPWMTPDAMGVLVGALSDHARPRLPFLNGFCYAIKRKVIDTIGLFDEERFAAGYCEENDYSHRARLAGFELAVADDVYVFHAKSRSYGTRGRALVAREHFQAFKLKHVPRDIERLVADLEEDEQLAGARKRLRGALAGIDDTAVVLRDALQPLLRIMFVLPSLAHGGSGGSHSIYQEATAMRELGVDASIAIAADFLERARAAYPGAEDVFRSYEDVDELASLAEDADVLIATHHLSTELVATVAAGNESILPAYYVQDYEAFFVRHDPEKLRLAEESYAGHQNQLLFAKTRWLCEIVGRKHDVPVAKVEPSLDRSVFHAAGRVERAAEDPIRVVAMVRPRTRRRQPRRTVQLLEALASSLGSDVDVAAFGCTADELAALGGTDRSRSLGMLSRDEVASVLRGADVFVDLSSYQAFGRTALEAMACGCVPVVPGLGGANEFAEGDANALVVDTDDLPASLSAVADLAADRPRLERLRAAALMTAGRYSTQAAALSEYLLFADAHARSTKEPASRPSSLAPATSRTSIEELDLRRYDFIDLGCSEARSVAYGVERFGGGRGLGVDLDEQKVVRANVAGIEAIVADATALRTRNSVRFVTMLDFLEHLPDLIAVERAVASAAEAATDFLFIKHPSFEGREAAEAQGVRQYWWRWSEHTAQVRVADYCSIFDRLGLNQYMVRYMGRIEDSRHPSIIPASWPTNQTEEDARRCTDKPHVTFDPPLWRRQDIFVALRPFDPEEWARVCAPTETDHALLRAA